MAQMLDQFAVTPLKAVVRNADKGQRYEVQNLGAADLVPGDVVKLKDVAGHTIAVEKIVATTDVPFGMVQYEAAKGNVYHEKDMLTVASDYSIIVCEASAAIAVGQKVMPVIEGQKVAVATAPNYAIGTALDKAALDGDFIRVLLQKPELIAG